MTASTRRVAATAALAGVTAGVAVYVWAKFRANSYLQSVGGGHFQPTARDVLRNEGKHLVAATDDIVPSLPEVPGLHQHQAIRIGLLTADELDQVCAVLEEEPKKPGPRTSALPYGSVSFVVMEAHQGGISAKTIREVWGYLQAESAAVREL